MSSWRLLTAVILIATRSLSAAGDEPIVGDIYEESRSFSYPYRNALQRQHKCQREVPALYYQTSKTEPVRGNGSTIHYHRIEVCCEGYSRSAHDWQKCLPDCMSVSPNNCHNGFCRAPNQCVCFEEFVRNERGECVHTCPIACEHGRCYLNGTCECERGYTLDPQTRKFCRPECPQACGTHQECVAPGQCACAKGYKMTDNMGCQPVCTPDCGHGKCVGPNQCECFEGYIKRPQRNVCEAECYINCENGFCESRYKCQCRNGYKYDPHTTSCLPDCGEQCQNGVCIAPGVCKCFENYELKDSECVPVCIGGCGYYGKCIEPNICGCGTQQQACILGNCDALGRCHCPPGLTRFISQCVDATRLNVLVSTYDQREYFDKQLQREFDALIGHYFQYMS